MVVSWLTYSSTLILEVIFSSEISVTFHRSTRCYIAQDRIVYKLLLSMILYFSIIGSLNTKSIRQTSIRYNSVCPTYKSSPKCGLTCSLFSTNCES
jgi:branched-subunit amino acid permease